MYMFSMLSDCQWVLLEILQCLLLISTINEFLTLLRNMKLVLDQLEDNLCRHNHCHILFTSLLTIFSTFTSFLKRKNIGIISK